MSNPYIYGQYAIFALNLKICQLMSITENMLFTSYTKNILSLNNYEKYALFALKRKICLLEPFTKNMPH